MKLKINFKPYAKMCHYTLKARGEVSGIGKVVKEGDSFLVKDLFIFPQICTPAYTSLDEVALANFITDLAMKGEPVEQYSFWFHTHSDMPVFWSNVDEDNIQTHSRNAEFISLVMNKNLDFIARADCRGARFDFSPREIVVLPTGNNKLWGKCNNQVERMVTNDGFH